MSKKLITACLGLLALAAFALPAAASAANEPTITHPTGTVLNPTGKTCTTGLPGICILATNTTIAKFKSGSTTLSECSTVRITGALSKNTMTGIEGTIHTATFSGTGPLADGISHCTSSVFGGLTATTNGGGVDGENVTNGTPWCMKSSAVEDKFTVRGGSCSQEPRAITFILDSTSAGECKYSRTAAIEGTFTTHSTGDAIVSLAPDGSTEFTKEAGGILCPGSGSLEMSFTMETDTGTAEPLYIS